MALRVVSYNIRKAVGLDWRRSPARVLRVLNELDPDVALLQEADKRLGARPTALPREMIARETSLEVVDLAVGRGGIGWHGNAVLVRRSLPIEGRMRLELPGLEPRGAVLVRVAGLWIVGTHLGLLRRWRHLQMATILRHLGPMTKNALVAGDFNEWSPARGFEPWEDRLHVVAPGPSFHASRPVASLDRFAHGNAVRILDHGVAERSLAGVASDHLPVWASVEPAQAIPDSEDK
ncbi:endonuclease/exonuclease/phosphatase family protein [Histidinibacterium aquaticum]|uniref:Metal-dependent hydrolase n=1 Tax=Histidinibacterium aquaticum TaxID=2613962 RepID=A0A5J5GPL2_9RHOB|nr:endonuclease/exonuclease/phosphatase family protein [Histidinibacterium aquaticum]KAA9009464.1 metal-dependent hydrolase [Histidinibacterium aquaticum]